MILKKIKEKTIERLNHTKYKKPFIDIKAKAFDKEINNEFIFEKALVNLDISFICEIKRASPSKSIIVNDFPYKKIALDYEKAGANAISVLTEPYFFKGSDIFLEEISKITKTPLLRKDFTIDEYMIYEAKAIGANAILLICSLLSQNQLEEYIEIAESLGLSVLVETHNIEEIEMANNAKAKIIGVNNRNLKNFTIDINNSIELRPYIKNNAIFISESGISKPEHINTLRKNNVHAVLIGETLMKAKNKKEMLNFLKGF